MTLKAEGAALDCFEVTLKCEDDDEAMVVAVIPRPEPVLRVAQQEKTPAPRPMLPEASDSCEEPRLPVTWEQEFLVGSSPGGSGRALCMVCGAEIRAPSADTARSHILEQHPHTLDLTPAEKSNILEAWSEGLELLQHHPAQQPSPCLPDLGQEAAEPESGIPDTTARMPAEIVVLLDSEDSPALEENLTLPRRIRPRGLRPLELPATPVPEPGGKKLRSQRWRGSPEEEPARKKRARAATRSLYRDLDSDSDSDLDLEPAPQPDLALPDTATETFAAPPEVRHFTDGTFPPGFVLQLFSHTQLRADSKGSPQAGDAPEGDLTQPQSPSAAPPPGLRGTLDLQVIRVRMEEPPAVSLLPDWTAHPQAAKSLASGDPHWSSALSESSTAPTGGQPAAESGL